MPKLRVSIDQLTIWFLENDDFFNPKVIDVTPEEKVWVERTMKKFWAVQDFLIEKVKHLES
jgi:hypothetical protein